MFSPRDFLQIVRNGQNNTTTNIGNRVVFHFDDNSSRTFAVAPILHGITIEAIRTVRE